VLLLLFLKISGDVCLDGVLKVLSKGKVYLNNAYGELEFFIIFMSVYKNNYFFLFNIL
jgi:hypothetical protein